MEGKHLHMQKIQKVNNSTQMGHLLLVEPFMTTTVTFEWVVVKLKCTTGNNDNIDA
jgi:hypothetical protein